MSKQEEIKEQLLEFANENYVLRPTGMGYQECMVDDMLSYLHSQGVVIKVDKELPFVTSDFSLSAHGVYAKVSTKALSEQGYVATEPLIELCPQCSKEPHLCKCATINRGSFAKYVEPVIEEE